MWLTERTILELAQQHQDDLVRAHNASRGSFNQGPRIVLPQPCCRLLARLGHRLMIAGERMETRYTRPLRTA